MTARAIVFTVCAISIFATASCSNSSLTLPTVPEEEEARLLQQLVDCMRINADALDDDTSDAETIARAVSTACRPEAKSWYKAIAGGTPVFVWEGSRQAASIEEYHKQALTFVLQGRARRRRSPAR